MTKTCGNCRYFIRWKTGDGICELDDLRTSPQTKGCESHKNRKYKREKKGIRYEE